MDRYGRKNRLAFRLGEDIKVKKTTGIIVICLFGLGIYCGIHCWKNLKRRTEDDPMPITARKLAKRIKKTGEKITLDNKQNVFDLIE